jgi:hypothetical protein
VLAGIAVDPEQEARVPGFVRGQLHHPAPDLEIAALQRLRQLLR